MATTSSITATTTSRHRGGFAARPGRADPARRGSNDIADIEKQIADFGKRAGEGKLGIEELTGGTFTIERRHVWLDALSADHQPAAKRHPRRACDKDRAVVENSQIVIRPMNYLAMSMTIASSTAVKRCCRWSR